MGYPELRLRSLAQSELPLQPDEACREVIEQRIQEFLS